MAIAAAWARYATEYHLVNAAVAALYFALRLKVRWDGLGQRRYLQNADQLRHWEQRAFWMLLALAAGKFIRRSTPESYMAEMLGYLKLCAAVLLCAADARLGACLLLLYLLAFLLFPSPRYDGPQHVDLLTPAAMSSKVLRAGPAGATAGSAWLVMFTAPWSGACAQAQTTFARLSLEYAGEGLRFGEMDVGRWPRVARDFDVSIDALPYQLPAFMLFRGGKLAKRIPKKDETWQKKGTLRATLLKEFDLDMFLASALRTV